MKAATKDDYINQISDIFYEAVEKDLAPWSKPWKAEDFKYNSHNPMSKSAYKGNNALLLETLKLTKGYNSNAWLTFNQVKELGGSIEKGSKSAPVVFYSKIKKTDEELAQDDRNEYKFILKKYSVFNLDQVKGLSEEKLSKLKLDEEELAKNDFLTIDECEEILNKTDVKIFNSPQSRAFYMPEKDEIHLPLKEQFSSLEAYYSVAFHELGHSTGHKDRLDRDLSGKFGTESYAKEELRAEIYSFLQAKELGIDYNLENHQSYVKSWAKEFENKKEEIYEAVKDSLKMVDFVRENYIEKAIENKAEKKEEFNYEKEQEDLKQLEKKSNYLDSEIFKQRKVLYKRESEIIKELSNKYSKGSIKGGKGKKELEANEELIFLREKEKELEEMRRQVHSERVKIIIKLEKESYKKLDILVEDLKNDFIIAKYEKSIKSESRYLTIKDNSNQTILNVRFSDHGHPHFAGEYIYPVYFLDKNYSDFKEYISEEVKKKNLLDKALDHVKDEVKDEIKDEAKEVLQEHFKDEISYLKDEAKEVLQELNPKVFEKLNENLATFVGIESNPIKKTKDILFQA